MENNYLKISGFIQPYLFATEVRDGMTKDDLIKESLYDVLLDDIEYRINIGEAYDEEQFEFVDVDDIDDFYEYVDKVAYKTVKLLEIDIIDIEFYEYYGDDRTEFGWDYWVTIDIDLNKLYAKFKSEFV